MQYFEYIDMEVHFLHLKMEVCMYVYINYIYKQKYLHQHVKIMIATSRFYQNATDNIYWLV